MDATTRRSPSGNNPTQSTPLLEYALRLNMPHYLWIGIQAKRGDGKVPTLPLIPNLQHRAYSFAEIGARFQERVGAVPHYSKSGSSRLGSTRSHGHAGGMALRASSPKTIEAPQALPTPIWVEKTGPSKTVGWALVRVCSPNTLESTLPADRKARCANNQCDEPD